MKKSSDDRDIRSMGQIKKRSTVLKAPGNSHSIYNDSEINSRYCLLNNDGSVPCSTAADHCPMKIARYSEHIYESKSNITNCNSVSTYSVPIKQENLSDGFSNFLSVNHKSICPYTDSVISSTLSTGACQSCLNIHTSRFPENLCETSIIRTKSEIVEIPFKVENNCSLNQSCSGETDQFNSKHLGLNFFATSKTTNSVVAWGDSLSLSDMILLLEQRLSTELLKLDYNTPVSHIYNPIEYAIVPHKAFLNRYCTDYKDILFLGMNPGPYGMAQTGVPFGEISMVRDWLRISGQVMKPKHEHPKRPILGFNCKRKEVSGARFWKLFAEISGTPELFFKRCFVHNMCPLLFMSSGGKNLTPPDLPINLRRALNSACDLSLCNVVKLLRVKFIVGVGRYASDRAKIALTAGNIENVVVVNIMHPSPANPVANKGWNEIVTKQLIELDLMPYISSIQDEELYAKMSAI